MQVPAQASSPNTQLYLTNLSKEALRDWEPAYMHFLHGGCIYGLEMSSLRLTWSCTWLSSTLKALLILLLRSSQTGVPSIFPGTTRSSVTRCKPGPNCPSSHSSISRQLSPLSVTEDSSAPILELQSRGSSGVCGRRVERQSRSGMWVTFSSVAMHSHLNRQGKHCLGHRRQKSFGDSYEWVHEWLIKWEEEGLQREMQSIRDRLCHRKPNSKICHEKTYGIVISDSDMMIFDEIYKVAHFLIVKC